MHQHALAKYIATTATGLLLSSFAYASDAQTNAIQALGQLNGVALQCQYLQHTQQIKQALVSNLPKQRALGEIFDNASNESFLDFIKLEKTCPAESLFSQQVDAAISALQQAYHQP